MASDPARIAAAPSPQPPASWQRFRHPSLRLKLLAGLGGLLLILFAVSGLSVAVLTHYGRTLQQVYRENYHSVAYCEEMKEALDGINGDAQRLLFDERQSGDEAAAPWEAQFAEAIAQQQSNSSLPTERKNSDALADDWQRYRNEYQRFAAGPTVERRKIYREILMPHSRTLRAAVQEISSMNLQYVLAVDERVRTTVAAVRSALVVLAAGGSILAILFVFAVGSAVLRPLSALTRSAREIADGQLDAAVDVRTLDEMGQLAEAFNVMAARLRAARERDRDRLVRTEQTTQMAIDSLPDAVVVLNADGGIELSNRAAEQFGLTPRNGGRIPTWLSSLHHEVLRTAKACEPDGYRAAIQKFIDGEEHFFLPHAVPLAGEGGRTVGVTVVLADVTRLKAADEAKSDLVSTVSHELRTPLTSIRMAVHMLADGTFGDLGPKQAELLATARENSDRLHRILENLLGISRIESGRAPLTLERAPAATILFSAVAPLRESFAAASVGLEMAEPSPELIAMADLSCVGHVLTNLLTNALRHSPAGGAVRVSCAAEDDDRVSFAVSDDGPGIPPEHLPHIFEKFYRVGSSEKPAGAGLGLAIAKEIVEAHGGVITAGSPPGSGATFRFTLRRV